MSYEGFVQVLCGHHHKSEINCYDYSDETFTCNCGNKEVVWSNGVDQTNGTYCNNEDSKNYNNYLYLCRSCEFCDNGRIDGYIELEIDTPARKQTCNLGHEHIIEPPTYKIPKDK